MGKAKRVKKERQQKEASVLDQASWDRVSQILRDCNEAVVTASAGSKLLVDRARAGDKSLPGDTANDVIELARSIQSIQTEIKNIAGAIPTGRPTIDAHSYPHYLSLMEQSTDVFVRVTNEIAPRVQSLSLALLTEDELNNA